jgi:hypothetical protein
MEAIRQFVKVKNNEINITLPSGFNSQEVEVIILSTNNYKNEIPNWQKEQVRERSAIYHKNPSIALDIDEVMKKIEDEL